MKWLVIVVLTVALTFVCGVVKDHHTWMITIQNQLNHLEIQVSQQQEEINILMDQIGKQSTPLQVEATAYTHTGNPTKTGVMPERGHVAVDPRIIPLGSTLYIEGYGIAKATDTGGDIKGFRVDLFMESKEECIKFGRQEVKVIILNWEG